MTFGPPEQDACQGKPQGKMIAVIVEISFQSVSIHLCLQIFHLFSASMQILPLHVQSTYLGVSVKKYYLPQGMCVDTIGKKDAEFCSPQICTSHHDMSAHDTFLQFSFATFQNMFTLESAGTSF